MPQTAPYGSWKSPISPDVVISKSLGFGNIQLDGQDIYWLEVRPEEKGRGVIVCRRADGTLSDLFPAPFNARTMAHEYGGGDFCVADGIVYFSNFADQRIYRVTPGTEPAALTPEGPFRYADAILDARRNRLICVREDHTVDEPAKVVNTLVAVDCANGAVTLLAEGHDFYSSPCLNPAGDTLAWLAWDHPNMPWDGTRLFVADIQPGGRLALPEQVAGGPTESIFQPQWSPDGTLHFMGEHTGWWNLYRRNGHQLEALFPMDAEFGLPQWVFGMSTYGFENAENLLCAFNVRGDWSLGQLNPAARAMENVDLPFTTISQVRVGAGFACFVAGAPTEPTSIIRLDLTDESWQVLRRAINTTVDATYISVPQLVEFPTTDERTAFAYYYPPHNPDFAAPEASKPPVVVMIHGGPTSATNSVLRYNTQYWTSRGFGVLDVNYGGSTGYGREYRQRLNGQWGIVDLDDCVNGVRYLVERGLADPEQLAIRGGSAGGYTTLAALTFRDVFRAGASYFGVSDIEALALDTHKFESRYMDSLVGPYPAAKETYVARSPIHFTRNITRPLILFQGLDDKVVPPNQSDVIYEAVRSREIPVAYIKFEGEGHGFRRAENQKRSLEAEYYFYAKMFGFTPADTIEPVEIENQ